jgi:hypothetical protein
MATNPQAEPMIIGLLLLDVLSLLLVSVVLVGRADEMDEVALSDAETNAMEVDGAIGKEVVNAKLADGTLLVCTTLETTAGAEVTGFGATVVVVTGA